jgi:uncharacterized protein GlcG (DUF336 family)
LIFDSQRRHKSACAITCTGAFFLRVHVDHVNDQGPNLNRAQAQAAIEAATQKAQELSLKMDIASVEAGANLTAFARMDGSWLGFVDIAIRKARTSRFFDMPTGDLGTASQPGGPLYNIEHSNSGLITFPGGTPIKDASGEVIGAIGV